ncbi:MAG: hypoxanthine phosphoribosyltransferase [Planctomycetes bacterium]|nr:hypoxanthine phosphoribosyltransferase [Planctomycetota bacterium]
MSTPGEPPFRVLLPERQIVRRIRELARALQDGMGSEPPCLVAVIEGARPLAAMLQRLLPGSLPLHEVAASSYRGTASSGQVSVVERAELPCRGRDVVLIEDIVDTGRTVAALRAHFGAKGARHCRVVTLLDKPDRRCTEVAIDHVGFTIPDEFVIGFGMDIDGRYRALPDIVIYDAEVERAFAGRSRSDPAGG